MKEEEPKAQEPVADVAECLSLHRQLLGLDKRAACLATLWVLYKFWPVGFGFGSHLVERRDYSRLCSQESLLANLGTIWKLGRQHYVLLSLGPLGQLSSNPAVRA